MGLDIVELVMDAEDEFEINLLDTDTFTTVGEMEELVWKKLQQKAEPGVCPNVIFALRLRHALVANAGASRAQIRLTTKMDDVLPKSSRAKVWTQMTQAVGVPLPKLSYSRRLVSLFWLTVTVLCGWAAFSVGKAVVLASIPALVVGLPLVLLLLWMIVVWITGAEPCTVPKVAHTMRDLVSHLATRHGKEIIRNKGPLQSREEVREKLYSIIAKHANRPASELRPENRFVQDLGLG